MTGINLDVGDEIDFETQWLVDNTAITTGSATLEGKTLDDSLTVKYVQDDLTLDPAPNTLDMNLLTDSWNYPLTIPNEWDGRVIKFTKVHSDPDTFPGYTNVRVGLVKGGTLTNPQPSARFD